MSKKKKSKTVESGPIVAHMVPGLLSGIPNVAEARRRPPVERAPRDGQETSLLQQLLEEFRGMRYESRKYQRDLLHVLQQAGHPIPGPTDFDTAVPKLRYLRDGTAITEEEWDERVARAAAEGGEDLELCQ